MHTEAKGKISCAGPALEQTIEEGSGEKDKLLANENAVASSIKEPVPSTKNNVACSCANDTSLLQRKIQQLKKQFRPFDDYTVDPKNQLVLSDNPSTIDTSVISYVSKGPVQKLNCKAKNRTDGGPIACRHLAYAFVTGGFGFKTNVNQSESKEPGGKFNAVASIDNICNNAAIKTDQQLKKTPIRCGIPKEAIYFDAEHIGQALYDAWMNKGAGDLASHGKPSQTWLLVTENHVMAIRLVPTAGSAIKIEWYDPNYTTIVRRVIVLNEHILQQLTLDQFVSMPVQKRYVIDQGRVGVIMSAGTVEVANDSDISVLAALTPSLLYLLMHYGQLNNSFLDSLKTKLSELRSDNPHGLIELLAAKGYGGPGLFMALQNGHHETISAYFECIKQLRDIIEPEVIKELLAAKRGDGPPGLFIALQLGNQGAISAYIEGIKQLQDIIEPDVIKELLAARGDRTPGLFMALQIGNQKAVSAYIEGIRQLRDIIGPEGIKELLAAKDEDGTPGLFIALQLGNQGAISAYIEGIKQLQDIIEPDVIKELLAARDENGTSGLFIALKEGHKDAVSAYVEGIKQLPGIIKVIWELLAAKNLNGAPGLFAMLRWGNQKAVRAYMECIKQLGDIVEPEVIKELLAAKRGDGTPSLFMALRNGHQEAVSAYLEGIKQLRDIIEPEVIRELLTAKKSDGTPGLCVALENGHHETASAYIEGIEQFGGVIEQRVIEELLAAKVGNGTPGILPDKTVIRKLSALMSRTLSSLEA